MSFRSWSVLRPFLGIAIALVASSLFAVTAQRYAGSDWALLDAKAVMTAAAEITPAAYPDSDDATVDQKSLRVYAKDGTAESQDETFTKVLTEAGKRSDNLLSLDFTLPYSTVEVARLEIFKPNGEVVLVDVAANAKESIDDSQMEANIYDPNSRVLRVNIPQLEVGDVVHSVTRRTTERPVMAGEYAEASFFEGSGYIRHISYEVRAPSAKPLRHIVLKGEVPGTVTASTHPDAGGTLVYHWEVNRVPRMYDEPAMPAYQEVLQRLLVSTTPDWPAISRWYWQLTQPHLETITPEMKAVVQQLTASAPTDRDKLKAVFYWVSKNIRYMGITPEKDRPGFEPHDVSLTFEKKYGVCRDKAALLVALLRTAGFKAYPVLTNVGAKIDPENPGVEFNHAIAAVELKPGSYVLMDPTDQNTQELLPAYEGNQSYLVCRPEGEELKLSPVDSPERNMLRVQTTGTLAASGALTARSELWFEGINDNQVRSALVLMKPDDIWRDTEASLKRAISGAALQSLKITPEDMHDTSSAVHAVMEFTVNHATIRGHGQAVAMVPWIANSWGVANALLGATGLEQRRYPMKTGIACGLQENISLKLADDFAGALSLPTCVPVENPGMSYRRQFAVRDGSLVCSRELKLKLVEFSPEQYLELKRALQGTEYEVRKMPILAIADQSNHLAEKPAPAAAPVAAPPVASDLKLLEAHEEYAVEDAHTQTYRFHYVQQILTENGKKEGAELRINYNPAIEQARIISAVVRSATGQPQAISADETHVMDADWNAAAKRYTGAKVLVANLPGVEIGSSIEVEYEIKSAGKPFLSCFEPFQFQNELDKKTVRFTAPAGLKIQTMDRGPAGIFKTEAKTTGNGQEWLWTAEQVKALPDEGGTPPDWFYKAGVLTFVGDANAYFRELNDTLLDRSHQSTRAQERARQLTAQTHSQVEAIRIIRDFVAKAIRVAGPSFANLPLKELTAADTTLADGYGHDADRAILLHAMLAAVGLKPEFVLASDLPAPSAVAALAEAFPIPGAFAMPLVKVEAEGETYYVKIDQYARFGTTRYDGKLAIRLADQTYETVKAAKDCQTQNATDVTLSLSETGTARITILQRYYGTNYAAKNQYFSEVTPEDRHHYFQEIVANVAQGARPVGDLSTDFKTYPGTEQFTVELERFAVLDGNYLYFDLPVKQGLVQAGANRRTLPLYEANKSETTIRTVIELPPGYGHLVIAPPSATYTAPDRLGRVQISTTEGEGKFTIMQLFASSPAIVSPENFPALQELESTLENKAAWFFLLERDGK
jgi:transglutaminase-like putative cysteine protease